MRMKTTKALLFCSFTIVLLLGVVGIASAAPPVNDDPDYRCGPCDCQCGEMLDVNTPPFCDGSPKGFKGEAWGHLRDNRFPAACLVYCVQKAPKGNR